ncbi:Hypothetical predicted protein [Lecanosticta acicola]|uniref:Uncharacterized protein n=1 Tax=Lecanosticta acicola TaxID=111012 RepID=A0AAI9ECJ5_9PEZI|nr:Hypothetical predicted protein [Lecanosticta acicola]
MEKKSHRGKKLSAVEFKKMLVGILACFYEDGESPNVERIGRFMNERYHVVEQRLRALKPEAKSLIEQAKQEKRPLAKRPKRRRNHTLRRPSVVQEIWDELQDSRAVAAQLQVQQSGSSEENRLIEVHQSLQVVDPAQLYKGQDLRS